jgi:hypothetical protein
MHRLINYTKFFRLGFVFLLIGFGFLLQFGLGKAEAPAQIPTGSIPTVTGTPVGAIAVVLSNDQGFINVRGGPSTVAYDIVGVLVEGSQVPALGRSPGGDWIQIAYPGVPGGIAWVYSDLLDVRGSLPVVEPPPTATPQITSTIDPTLAAQFLVEVPPTRLPTFTEPPPLALPTFPVDAPIATQGRLPMGLIIIGMAIIGLFGTLISFLRGR